MRTRAMLAAAAAAVLTTAGVATVLPATTADAATVTPVTGLVSGTNGIAVGADGNLWVAEEFNDTVARLTPSGTLLGRYAVGDGPTTVTAGPGGRIWVAVTGAAGLAVLDTAVANPTPTFKPLSPGCQPIALVAGGDGKMYFSVVGASCSGGPQLGSTADTGVGATTLSNSGIGSVFDLAVTSGHLFAPDYDNDKILRLALGTTPVVDGTYTVPDGIKPDGIAVGANGQLWATSNTSGQVVRFPAVGPGGPVTAFTAATGTLSGAFGIVVAANGYVYAAGTDSGTVVRFAPDGTSPTVIPTPGSQPFRIIEAPGGGLLVTDQGGARILRIADGAPTLGVGAASITGATASVTATVDPRGNATQVVVDYGPTTSYGASTAALVVPATSGPGAVTVTVPGLAPGSTVHLRLRASNALGGAATGDLTVTTPPTPPGAKLGTKKAAGGKTLLKSLTVPGLAQGDKVKVSCKGGGCPPKAQPVKAKKAGTLKLTRLVKGAVLAPGAKVVVKVTRAGTTSTTTFTMVKGKKPTTS